MLIFKLSQACCVVVAYVFLKSFCIVRVYLFLVSWAKKRFQIFAMLTLLFEALILQITVYDLGIQKVMKGLQNCWKNDPKK